MGSQSDAYDFRRVRFDVLGDKQRISVSSEVVMMAPQSQIWFKPRTISGYSRRFIYARRYLVVLTTLHKLSQRLAMPIMGGKAPPDFL